MMKSGTAVGVMVCLMALLVATPSSAATLEQKQTAQKSKRSAADKKEHRVILQVVLRHVENLKWRAMAAHPGGDICPSVPGPHHA